MTPSSSNLDTYEPYSGSGRVAVGKGETLSISHTGNSTVSNDLKLLDVLVVPNITKNLLSISKLTSDLPVSVCFTKNHFVVQHRHSKDILARGRRERGLYILE